MPLSFNREIAGHVSKLGQNSGGPQNAVNGRRSSRRRRDAIGHLEVERIGVARGAGQQDENYVLGLVLRGHRSRADLRGGGSLRTQQHRAGDAGAQKLEELPPCRIGALKERRMAVRISADESLESIFFTHARASSN